MEYQYDEKGKLQKLTLTSSDTAIKYQTQEVREWHYSADNVPIDVYKIKNKLDSSKAVFILDEQGNVAEEKWSRNQKNIETYYYYYDQQHRLTDIVRFNRKLKKLMPDYVFEYDDKGHLAQMTQLSGSDNYFTWKYQFNEKGLKVQEICTDNNKKIVGKIEYKYENQ